MIRVAVLILWGCAALPVCGQDVKEVQNASTFFQTSVQPAQANIALPSQVNAPQGQVTLFADFASQAEKGTPLYLVNRSDKRLTFSSQGGDIQMKLEFQRPDGKWQRAQSHADSWCGNSYGQRILDPGQHFKLQGYKPTKGTAAIVRYACYGGVEVVSNAGAGHFTPEDVEAAQTDAMAMRSIPAVLVKHLKELPSGVEDSRCGVYLASLELMQILGGAPSLKAKAELWLNELSSRKQRMKEERDVKVALESVMKQPWSEDSDPERLMNHCVRNLEPSGGNALLLWQVLADLSQERWAGHHRPASINATAWKPALELAAQKVMNASADEQHSMLMLLNHHRLADEILPDVVFEAFLVSSNQALVIVAADALSRRARWERLVELGWKLPADSQIIVLSALARGQSVDGPTGMDGAGGFRQPFQESEEARFWLHCMSSQPLKVAQAWLILSYDCGERVPWRNELQKHLKAFLTTLADQDEKIAGEFELKVNGYDLRSAVMLLVLGNDVKFGYLSQSNRSDGRKDQLVSLLQRLLTHRGYETQTGRKSFGRSSLPYEERHFPLRDEACKALKQMGVAVSGDVEVVRDVTPKIKAN